MVLVNYLHSYKNINYSLNYHSSLFRWEHSDQLSLLNLCHQSSLRSSFTFWCTCALVIWVYVPASWSPTFVARDWVKTNECVVVSRQLLSALNVRLCRYWNVIWPLVSSTTNSSPLIAPLTATWWWQSVILPPLYLPLYTTSPGL